MRRLILTIALAAMTVQPASAGRVKADEPKPIEVSGKITDGNGAPVEGAQVQLIDRRTHIQVTKQTDAEGHFSIEHKRDQYDSLHIVPPVKSGLAEAMLGDIPSNEGRHVVVKLKAGVEVTGRILAAGKPLKGVTVRAIPKSKDAVHDGAEAVTNRKGQYRLLVTPGEKIIEVSNVKDSAVIGLHRETQHIRVKGALPDIEVPVNQ